MFRPITCKGKSPKIMGQTLLWGEPLELLFPSSCDLSVEAPLVAFLPPSCHIGAWRQGQKKCKDTETDPLGLLSRFLVM